MAQTKGTITVRRASPGWLGLVGVIFVTCKILEIGVVANWSWWLVLLPFYFKLAIVLVFLVGGAALAGIVFLGAWVIDEYNARQRRRARAKADMWRKLGGK